MKKDGSKQREEEIRKKDGITRGDWGGGVRSKEEKDGNKQSLQKLVGCEWMYGVREWT